MSWYEEFEKLRVLLSDETMFSAICNYFSSDQMSDFCNQVITDYDLENEFEEE